MALVAEQILREIRSRLQFLKDVGLQYLTLSRSAGTLSGGESQRIRLATQIGSSLMGVLYILDEPSIGLHQRDNDKLLGTLQSLRDLGNTLIVVEHDEDTMRAADFIVDVGPGAGSRGGEIVATGTLDEILAEPRSITGQYLSGVKKIPVPSARRAGNGKFLTVCYNELFNCFKLVFTLCKELIKCMRVNYSISLCFVCKLDNFILKKIGIEGNDNTVCNNTCKI